MTLKASADTILRQRHGEYYLQQRRPLGANACKELAQEQQIGRVCRQPSGSRQHLSAACTSTAGSTSAELGPSEEAHALGARLPCQKEHLRDKWTESEDSKALMRHHVHERHPARGLHCTACGLLCHGEIIADWDGMVNLAAHLAILGAEAEVAAQPLDPCEQQTELGMPATLGAATNDAHDIAGQFSTR